MPGRGPAIAIAIVGNLPLFLASIISMTHRSCGPQADSAEPGNLLLGLVLICMLAGPAHLVHTWLARRLWSRGPFAKFVCLVPPLGASLISILLALVLATVSGGGLC